MSTVPSADRQAPRRDRRRTTLAVVAEVAGVSTATVSKVLNNRPDVADRTRERVSDALREVGYEPTTPTPQNPGTERFPVVGVVFHDLRNAYSAQMLHGMLQAARALGVDVVVDVVPPDHSGDGRTDHATDREPLSEAWIRRAAAQRWCGVLGVTVEITQEIAQIFRRTGLPLVAVDPPNAVDDDTFASVGSTNFSGGMQAADHLIGLGHRRIAVAGGPLTSSIARERVHGYRSSLEAAGLEVDADLVRYGEFSFESGVAQSAALLDLSRRPTAIIAGCDDSALGVLESARRRGVRVPEDLSVVGFDDTPAAATSAPPLTTVQQPAVALARAALNSLLRGDSGDPLVSHHVQLATSLVVRASTAPPADS